MTNSDCWNSDRQYVHLTTGYDPRHSLNTQCKILTLKVIVIIQFRNAIYFHILCRVVDLTTILHMDSV